MSGVLVKNGLIVLPEGLFKRDIKVKDGVIVEIGIGLSNTGVDHIINASGKLVFPGIIDEHVHMREPGLEYKEGFEHGSRAAIKGGVTTVIDQPNTIPPVEDPDKVLAKAKLLENKAYTDFALLGVLHDENIEHFEEMIHSGVVGFKVFMGPTTGGISPPSDISLLRILERSRDMDVTVMFHAEDHSLVAYFMERIRGSGRVDPFVHVESRPVIAEVYAISKILTLASNVNARVHIAHVSSKEGLEAIKVAMSYGVRVTSETCPHYLLFEREDYVKYGGLIKTNPPIRGGVHREALLNALREGIISAIGSDHAPHTPEEKLRDMWSSLPGIPGVQTVFPLLLDMALKKLIPLTAIPRLMAENPARCFKLWPCKGRIDIGFDGDLVIVDPNKELEISTEWLEYRHKISPYVGWRLKGYVETVVLRGNVVVENGKLTGIRAGKWVTPCNRFV
ncbi:MAG: allantoinase AllB [Desulfurococcaceae archaeon]